MLLSTFFNKGEFIIKNGVFEMNYIVTKTFPIDFLEYIYSTASETISSPLNPSSGPFSVLAISDPFSSLDWSFKIIKVLHAQKLNIILMRIMRLNWPCLSIRASKWDCHMSGWWFKRNPFNDADFGRSFTGICPAWGETSPDKPFSA